MGMLAFRESLPMLRKYDSTDRILECHPSKDSLTGSLAMIKDLQHYYQTASSEADAQGVGYHLLQH